jgi:hypothetical protein
MHDAPQHHHHYMQARDNNTLQGRRARRKTFFTCLSRALFSPHNVLPPPTEASRFFPHPVVVGKSKCTAKTLSL